MTEVAAELARLVYMLPEDKAREVLVYARRLVEEADDEAWERVVARADPEKLRAFLEQAERDIKAGLATPLVFPDE